MGKRKVTPSMVDEWFELVTSGKEGLLSLTLKYDVSYNTIYKYLKERGITSIKQYSPKKIYKSRYITEEMVDEWVKLYGELSCSDIGRKYHVSSSTVSGRLKKRGVIVERRINSKPPVEVTFRMLQDWIELYEACEENCCSIARKYNVSPATVNRHLKQAGIKLSKSNIKHERANVNDDVIEEWIKLYETGNESMMSIARKYKVSPATVKKHFNIYGVETTRSVPHRADDSFYSENIKEEVILCQ